MNPQELALYERLDDFLSEPKNRVFENIFGEISSLNKKTETYLMWIENYFFLKGIFAEFQTVETSNPDLLTKFIQNLDILLGHRSFIGKTNIFQDEDHLLQFVENFYDVARGYYRSVKIKVKDQFYFQYSSVKGGRTVIENFNVSFTENQDNYIFFNEQLQQLLEDQMVKFSFTNLAFFPDPDLKIVCECNGESGESLYYLQMHGKNVCPISVNSAKSPYTIDFIKPDKTSLQPEDLIFDATSVSENVIIRLDGIDKDGETIASIFNRIEAGSVKFFIKKLSHTEILYIETVSKVGEAEYYVKHENKKIRDSDPNNSLRIDALIKSNTDTAAQVPVRSFMRFCYPVPPVGGFYEALSAPLSDIGKEQLNTMIDYMSALRVICNNQTVYAPFTSLIQSSGFGKTKLCLEMLQSFPGAYVVFRKPTDTGIPAMSSWMDDFRRFITSAPTDLFPARSPSIPGEVATLNDSSVGRFLIAVYAIIKAYFELFEEIYSNLPEKSHNPDTNNRAVIQIIGKQFMKEPSSQFSAYNPDFNISSMSFNTVEDIIRQISKIFSEFESKHPLVLTDDSFAFLLFLDELELMTETIIRPGRLSAVNIVRRGLHLLNSEISLLGIAIGTNSDALDFSPSIKDNSCRITGRTNLLSPLPLTGNFDLLSKLIEYHKVSLTWDNLRNRALFNVLVSLGRGLWSSCNLNSVVEIAMTKIRNGDQTCLGSRMAVLMMRADLAVNTHHVLARNLIRSYMSIVGYISTDAQDIKIGYSSEPVLAMAARSLLKEKFVRSKALYALKEYLERGAVDKGRIVETLFEYITLFAIDDAESSIEYVDEPDEVPPEFSKLSKCKSHILEIVEGPQTENEIEKQVLKDIESKMKNIPAEVTTNPMPKVKFESSMKYSEVNYSSEKALHYSVKSVSDFLKSLVGRDRFESIVRMIDSKLLRGIVNCSHFLQLEKIQEGDFANLCYVPEVKTMKKNVIDKALLTYGIQRQCGFVMPPNYFGIDFIVPFAFESSDQSRRTIYSFIAIQSKTSKENIYECAAKMSVNLHYCVCPNPAHSQKGTDCLSSKFNTKNSCSILEDYREMCENHISILLIAEEAPQKRSNPKSLIFAVQESLLQQTSNISELTTKIASTTLTLNPATPSSSETPMDIGSPESSSKRKLSASSPSPKPKIVIPNETLNLFEEELLKASNLEIPPTDWAPFVNHERLPSILIGKKAIHPVPDAVITKIVDPNLSVIQLLWNYSKDGSNDVAAKDFLPPAPKEKTSRAKPSKSVKLSTTEPTSIASESALVTSPATEISPSSTASTDPCRRVGTCIVSTGFSSFSHLFDSEGVKLLKYILEFERSSFHNVDYLHLPIVQNSLLNGKTCPYYQVNPNLRGMRDFALLPNPTIGYKRHYSFARWDESVKRCAIGPVDCTVPSAEIKYTEKDSFELGYYETEEEGEDYETEEYKTEDDE